MNVAAEDNLRNMGHHGQEEWWPEADGKSKLRGVHIQEIIDYALEYDMAFTPLELYPHSAPLGFEESAKMIWMEDECRTRFITWLQFYSAILIHPSHATAWDKETKKVYDPNGMIREIEGLQIIEAWLLTKSNQQKKRRITD